MAFRWDKKIKQRFWYSEDLFSVFCTLSSSRIQQRKISEDFFFFFLLGKISSQQMRDKHRHTSCRWDSFFLADRLRCFSSTAQYFSVSLSYFFLASCNRWIQDKMITLSRGLNQALFQQMWWSKLLFSFYSYQHSNCTYEQQVYRADRKANLISFFAILQGLRSKMVPQWAQLLSRWQTVSHLLR